ncbi:hypothetical protein VIBNISFn27_p10092 [Vibrio nigripulchritudo SFn27]|uniref:Thymidylate kinase n=1 Tax=Vibrio nigripulchritudo TaxID=28173 RepID=A0A9P1JLA3_9VIBR|nr:hypothetical protein [Vibrio nigripulchritudo]CBJ93122.1 Protein of unknown function [Vibrio nigripulchritudo]CCN85937.1 hypothetical protein VIBNIBLFn1_p0083 [Vibrio nigripulchritudo BLFn1]CCN91934.1 hypothetical protein VIBNISFn27_p10092 [Vibrio nigripulchritudo SFn27]CCN97734.1 hypothetical protein VIBNIENn2_p0082 [Vibrio nigripulchritudo ENn2]CCO43968.1 hypothetical protein VIBNISFn135_p10092 [Vibrio nigripulchritudo SFn135]
MSNIPNEIAFLGMDGIGKSTLCRKLSDILTDFGYDVEVVSWTKYCNESEKSYNRDTLRELYVGTFKMMYGSATTDTGPFTSFFPNGIDQFFDEQTSETLNNRSVHSNSEFSMLGAALVELAGNFALRQHVISPALDEGKFVIQETFGYKHIVKQLILARELALVNGTYTDDFKQSLKSFSDLNFQLFSTILAPRNGVVVTGTPELAKQWRFAQSGGANSTEDLALAGSREPDSYERMQNECNLEFIRYAENLKWPILKMENTTVERNHKSGLDVLQSYLNICLDRASKQQ